MSRWSWRCSGERWREAGLVLQGLAGVTLAQAFVLLAAEVFKAADRPDLLPKTSMISTFGSVLMMIAFLPLGVAGVAAGVSIAFLLSAVYAWRELGRVLALPLRTLGGILVGPAFASVTMAAALALLVAYVAKRREPARDRADRVARARTRCWHARVRRAVAQRFTGHSSGAETRGSATPTRRSA